MFQEAVLLGGGEDRSSTHVGFLGSACPHIEPVAHRNLKCRSTTFRHFLMSRHARIITVLLKGNHHKSFCSFDFHKIICRLHLSLWQLTLLPPFNLVRPDDRYQTFASSKFRKLGHAKACLTTAMKAHGKTCGTPSIPRESKRSLKPRRKRTMVKV